MKISYTPEMHNEEHAEQVPEAENKDSQPGCNVHLLSPIYSATNKFLGTGVILLGVGVPVTVAVPIALIGAACNFWVQYNFITKSANGPKSLDFNAKAALSALTPTWKDELMAGVTVVSSIAEGAGFAAGVYMNADANNLGLSSALVLSAIAFKFRQGTTMQADGQKIFIEQGKNFAETRVGKIANFTQQFPPGYPFLIDFNSWVKDFLPTLESILPAMAFHAFLQKRIDSQLVCVLLAPLVSTGEWYQQRGYSVNLIQHVQQLAMVHKPIGLAHLIDIIIRLYNESIGNIVNGRIVNDFIGIVIPPAIWNLITKISGNFFTGFVGGREVIKLLPAICEKVGITLPANFADAESFVKPIVASVCAIAAVSQYMAGYDKNLRGLPIGIKPLLEKVYDGSSVTGWHLQDVRDRFMGWTKHVQEAPQRFFAVGKGFVAELKSGYDCQKADDKVPDIEVGLRRSLL